jgi:hypothetical protein
MIIIVSGMIILALAHLGVGVSKPPKKTVGNIVIIPAVRISTVLGAVMVIAQNKTVGTIKINQIANKRIPLLVGQ